MPKMRKPLDLKVPPLRLIDDPMRHEGHRQAVRRDARCGHEGLDARNSGPAPAQQPWMEKRTMAHALVDLWSFTRKSGRFEDRLTARRPRRGGPR
jgi:hypothetical protein